jgi:hypothetical protein
MHVSIFETAAEFENASRVWLAREPRRNNLILSIARRAVKLAEYGRGWLISSDGGFQLALWRTPQHPVSISDGSIAAAQWAARCLPPDLPGVVGPSAVADAFSAEWWQAWVSLFADNSNPVSNGIYRRLGFRPELVYRTWLFG